MKVALVHDLLIRLGWWEKVLELLSHMYPDAQIFTLIYDEKKVWKVFPKDRIKYTPKSTQRIYDLTKKQRLALLRMPMGIESMDFTWYDIVIVSSTAFAHGIITKPETKCIVYYHTPARYMWDWTFEYRRDIGWSKGIKWYILNSQLKKLREWDYIRAQRHDITLANSNNVKNRLKKYYQLDARVVYPNVDVDQFMTLMSWGFNKPFDEYYIIISALQEYKNIHIPIKAFNSLSDKNLLIIWSGGYKEALQKMSNDNIYFNWFTPDDELVYLLQNARWFIFPWDEDFGITPIESFASWVPVFAYKAGWLAETMIEWVTGEFFLDKSGADFIEKFRVFDQNISAWKYKKEPMQEVAKRYSSREFERQIREIVWF